jgi:hypothetical protein
MKITKQELANIIKEEVGKALEGKGVNEADTIPTKAEFLKAAFARLKKGERGEGWWGQDTKFRGNLGLWKNSMVQKYRANIGKFKAPKE